MHKSVWSVINLHEIFSMNIPVRHKMLIFIHNQFEIILFGSFINNSKTYGHLFKFNDITYVISFPSSTLSFVNLVKKNNCQYKRPNERKKKRDDSTIIHINFFLFFLSFSPHSLTFGNHIYLFL